MENDTALIIGEPTYGRKLGSGCPYMPSLPTFSRLRRPNRVSPTTPTFLSEPDMPPPIKTCRVLAGTDLIVSLSKFGRALDVA